MSADRIRDLNDAFRRSLTGGRVMLTDGVMHLSIESRARLLKKVCTFEAFDAGNDPYGEHDFGTVDHAGEKYFFKIDCYDKDLLYGSENPADPIVTTRVMTIMRADEY